MNAHETLSGAMDAWVRAFIRWTAFLSYFRVIEGVLGEVEHGLKEPRVGFSGEEVTPVEVDPFKTPSCVLAPPIQFFRGDGAVLAATDGGDGQRQGRAVGVRVGVEQLEVRSQRREEDLQQSGLGEQLRREGPVSILHSGQKRRFGER